MNRNSNISIMERQLKGLGFSNPEVFEDYDEITRSDLVASAKKLYRDHPVLVKLKSGEKKDVIGMGGLHPMLNTNIEARVGGLEEMSWGYMGAGPHTLALNTLFQFTGDEAFAEEYQTDFVVDFLSYLPERKDIVIKKEDIEQWIAKRTNERF